MVDSAQRYNYELEQTSIDEFVARVNSLYSHNQAAHNDAHQWLNAFSLTNRLWIVCSQVLVQSSAEEDDSPVALLSAQVQHKSVNVPTVEHP